jgi:hypothetical protein
MSPYSLVERILWLCGAGWALGLAWVVLAHG